MPVVSRSYQGAHSPKVRRQADQIPFGGYIREPSQTELPEADDAFDPSEHWFDNNFSTTVSCFAFRSGELVLHPQCGGGGCRHFWRFPLFLPAQRDQHNHPPPFRSFGIRLGSVSHTSPKPPRA